MNVRVVTISILAAVGLALTGCGVTSALPGDPGPAVTNTHPAPPTVQPTTPTPTPTPTSTPPAAMGVSLPYSQSGSTKGTGTATVWTAEWTQVNPADYDNSPPKNGAFLVIDASVQGVSGIVSTNPNDWTLKDAVGHNYDYDWSGRQPIYDMAKLPPGEIARGYLTFDVPQGPMTLTMGEPGIGQTAIRWAIPAS